eukprot:6196336-Pleurochrysis_carterae.AAC.1
MQCQTESSHTRALSGAIVKAAFLPRMEINCHEEQCHSSGTRFEPCAWLHGNYSDMAMRPAYMEGSRNMHGGTRSFVKLHPLGSAACGAANS